MYAEVHEVTVTTDAGGDGTSYTTEVRGAILGIRYVKDATTPYVNGVGLAVTLERTGEAVLALASGGALLDATVSKYPRVQVHDGADGSVMTMDGTRKRVEPVHAGGDRVKLVVNAGGATKTGKFYLVVGG